jgi:preprotein translocase subunit SecG
MVALILMQRGAGAQAGSGFGGGASATVFGARGAGSFLTKATKWLAVAFFGLSLGIGIFISHRVGGPQAASDLGLMGGATTETEVPAGAAPAGDVPAVPTDAAPAAPAGDLPAAPVDAAPAAPAGDVPAAPAAAAPTDAAPEDAAKNGGNG